MMAGVWLAIGAAALLFALASFVGRGVLPAQAADLVQAVGSVVALTLMFVFAINAFHVEHLTNTGDVVARSYDSLGYLAMAFGFLLLADLVKAVFDALQRSREDAGIGAGGPM